VSTSSVVSNIDKIIDTLQNKTNMMARKRNNNPQRPKQNVMQTASFRGVYAIRRSIAEESLPRLDQITQQLTPELDNNVGRLFIPETMGITVVGFSRFDHHHKLEGPSTESVLREVASTRNPLVISLGRLGLFGSEKKTKLSFGVISDELEEEEEEIARIYHERGFRLKRDPNGEGFYRPHLSIGIIHSDFAAHYSDPRALERLEAISRIGEKGVNEIVLNPVELTE